MKKLRVYLRNIGKPIFIAANKAESRKVEEEAAEFYQFGFELDSGFRRTRQRRRRFARRSFRSFRF